MSLARQILDLGVEERLRSTTATVTDTSPFTIAMADGVEIANVPRLDSYTPVVNDVVFVLRPDTGVLVIGKIA